MVTVVLGSPNHDTLPGVSTADHHTATVAGDLNLADLAVRAHGNLTGIVAADHHSEVLQASQSALEAETNENTYVAPDLLRHAPGVAKVWCNYDQTVPSITGSYNVDSVTDSGTGDSVVVVTDDFSAATYSVVVNAENSVSGARNNTAITNLVVGSYAVVTSLEDATSGIGALVDGPTTCSVAFGDQ